MQTNRWYWLQAAKQTGVAQQILENALLLFEDKVRHYPITHNLMLECLIESGLSLETISKIRHNYLKLIEYQSLLGGISR